MKKLFILILTLGLLTSCSTDDSNSDNEITKASIHILNSNNEPLKGITVYAFNENTWSTIGNDPRFANFEASSDENGIATFSNLNSDIVFNDLTNYTQNYRFTVHYDQDGEDKSKMIAITFEKGDTKSDKIILN